MGHGLDHGLSHVLSTPMNTKCVLLGNDAMNSSKDYSLLQNACKNAERLVNKCIKWQDVLALWNSNYVSCILFLPSRVCRSNKGAKPPGGRCGSWHRAKTKCKMRNHNGERVIASMKQTGTDVRFSKDPKTLRARKAIRKTPTRLFCKPGLFICCKGNKN